MQRLYKPLVFLICLLPFGLLLFSALSGGLGANPIEEITHVTGQWGLRFLLITLAITPLRRLTRINSLIRYRRMLGLYAFFYVGLHFLSYLILDQFFDWREIIKDIIERPYISVGFLAFLLLIPLALTSTKKMLKKLGGNWQRLHRLIYVIGILSVLHFLWLVKADLLEPLIYGAILAVLLILRLPQFRSRAVGKKLRN